MSEKARRYIGVGRTGLSLTRQNNHREIHKSQRTISRALNDHFSLIMISSLVISRRQCHQYKALRKAQYILSHLCRKATPTNQNSLHSVVCSRSQSPFRTSATHTQSPTLNSLPPPKSSRQLQPFLLLPFPLPNPPSSLCRNVSSTRSSLEGCPLCLTTSPRRTLAMAPYVPFPAIFEKPTRTEN